MAGGRCPPGTTFASPVAQIDIFADGGGRGRRALPSDRKIDGVNLVPFVRGEAAGPPHQSLFWRSGGYRTMIAGGWKLQVSERPKKDWLFHLADDPTEHVDLAATNPDKVRELKAVLASYEAEMLKPAWPSLIEAAIDVDHPLGVPERPSDEYVYWEN